MLRIVDALPRNATILDLGAGHGVFAVLATHFAGARVTTLEPDARKVRPIAGIRSVIGYDASVRGSFDVVTIVDVLYKIPMTEWDALLSRIDAKTLIVKEQDPTAPVKNLWNRVQESVASFLGITMGEGFGYEAPSVFAERLRRAGYSRVDVERIDRGYPHPHVLYVGQRPG